MTIPLTNPNAEAGQYINLLGFRRYFVIGTPGVGARAIHLGHVRNPARTPAITEKTVETAINGISEEVKIFTTKIAQSGTFESASAGDLTIRALHAGGPLITSPLVTGAAAFQATHAYALNDIAVPVTRNGHSYKATTAGTSAASEPVWPTATGGTVVSGTVTFTEQGVDSTGYSMILENHAYTYGMMIEVNLNGEDNALPCEINVAPNVGLRGDGYGSGFDGQNETLLKFAEKILSVPSTYTLPTSIGVLGSNVARGVILLPSVPASAWQSVVTSLITGT